MTIDTKSIKTFIQAQKELHEKINQSLHTTFNCGLLAGLSLVDNFISLLESKNYILVCPKCGANSPQKIEDEHLTGAYTCHVCFHCYTKSDRRYL
jgi:3-oxoacyl-[acyl-carrier-protein] synthase III